MLTPDDHETIGRGIHDVLDLSANIVKLVTAHPAGGPGDGGGRANYRKLFHDLEQILREIESEILKDQSIKPPPPPLQKGTAGV